MKLFRFSELIAVKYKIAAEASDLEKNEAEIRRMIVELWNVGSTKPELNASKSPYAETLRGLSSLSLQGKPTNTLEEQAKRGHALLKHILNITDVMKLNVNKIDLQTLRAKLEELRTMLQAAMAPGTRGTVDFPDVSSLVFLGMEQRTKLERDKFKTPAYVKARTGLIRIFEIAGNIISKLNKFEGLPSTGDPTIRPTRSTQKQRLYPQRAPLAEYDIVPFLRQYGLEYGLRDNEDWATAFRDDPMFKEEITTVINALDRGLIPADEASVKMEIARVIKEHEERKATNKSVFNMPETKFQQVVNVPPQVEEDEEES